MQVLDDAPIDHGDALALGLRLRPGLDLAVGQRDFLGRGGEDRIGRLDLRGVDQGLAVEAEIAALFGLGGIQSCG